MNSNHRKRGIKLPKGCKDLGDVLKRKARKRKEIRPPMHTNEEIREVFRRHVPAIATGVVEIVALARNVGRRCLVAVRSSDPKVSPVAACEIKRGERLAALVAELGGEFPSIMLWRPAPEEFIREAFSSMSEVALDADARQAEVTIRPAFLKRHLVRGEDPIARMISETTGLVSEITGWKITLASVGNG